MLSNLVVSIETKAKRNLSKQKLARYKYDGVVIKHVVD